MCIWNLKAKNEQQQVFGTTVIALLVWINKITFTFCSDDS